MRRSLSSRQVVVAAVLFPLALTAATPQVWFAPLDDISRSGQVLAGVIPSSVGGPTDFMNLFVDGAPWTQAATHVSVFKMYEEPLTGNLLGGGLSDAQLQQIFSFLKQHNIALAMELSMLIPSSACGYVNQSAGIVIEGFAGGIAQKAMDRIKANGGTLSYVAMDEPFQHAHDACGWSGQQVAANALTVVHIVKTAFPGAIIGDIEVVPDSADSGWLADYAAWFDAFEQVTGYKLGFFHCDTAFLPDWMDAVAALRTEAARRGIPLGMIYNGLESDSSDVQWISRARQNFTEFELSYAPPDQAIFQSWTAYPFHSLPETAPNTFTWLIDQYVLPRPSLSLNISAAQASGRLLNAQGNGIASASVSVTMQPTSGPGVIGTYTFTGTVPSGITKALIQMCVNLCGTTGTNNVSLYSYQYTDSQSQTSLDFSKGFGGWGVDGSGTASAKLGSDAGGPFLAVAATSAQFTFVNSSTFAVTPGSDYTLTVKARISPDSLSSGYFALIFVVSQEVSRDPFPFAVGTVPLGNAQTLGDGSYVIQISPQNTGVFQAIANYAGNGVLWPARATAPITIQQPGPLLTISVTHAGNFAMGQSGATYAVTISNQTGSAATNSAVTVTDTIPQGFTLVSMAGAGWSCSGAVCSRGDPLAGGAGYPPITVTVNVSSSAPARVTNQVNVAGGGSPSNSASDSTTITAPVPLPTIQAIVDSWDYTAGATPGAWVTITGTNLASGAPQTWNLNGTQQLPTSLGGVMVTFNAAAAALLYVSPTQINALVPASVSPGPVQVVVQLNGVSGGPFTITATATQPAIYAPPSADGKTFFVTAALQGTGFLVGNSTTDPRVIRAARPGDILDLYMIGLGTTADPSRFITSQSFSGAYPVSAPVTASVGGESAQVLFAGLTSPGLYLVRIGLPSDLGAGPQTIQILAGSAQTSSSLVLMMSATPANLIQNGSFESVLTGTWVSSIDSTTGVVATIQRTTSTAIDGSYSAQIDVSTAATASSSANPCVYCAVQFLQTGLPIKQGNVYELQFWAKADTSRTMNLNIIQAGAPFNNEGLATTVALGGAWQRYVIYFQASATDPNGRVTFFFGDQAGNAWLDNISLQ